MVRANKKNLIVPDPRRSSWCFGLVLFTAVWMSVAAFAEELTSPPASAASKAAPRIPSGQAQENDLSTPLAQELAGAQREVELLQHLAKAHERAERLDQDLASARRNLDTQAALVIKAKDEAAQIAKASEAVATDLRQAVEKERGRAEALAASLTKIRHELSVNQAQMSRTVDEAAELRRQIASSGPARQAPEDKDRIAALERDLATARRETAEQNTLLASAREETAQLKKFAEAENVKVTQAAQKARERSDTLAGELARDLGAARRDVDAQISLATRFRNDAERLREDSARDTASLREQLRSERLKIETLERALAAAGRRTNLSLSESVRVAVTPAAVLPSVPDGQMDVAPGAGLATAVDASVAKPTPEMAAASASLVARANSLLGQGDIIAARTVLERAAMMGNAKANFALAETYDPAVLARWGTYGTRGDPDMARKLYTKAVADGIEEAKERAEALRR
jgi:predicted  nucleic acid-binding Zn-ribbon protein